MPVQITIRNVPDEVRDELKIRAAHNRQSMQAYLLAELERLATRPASTNQEILQRARERLERTRTTLSAETIVNAIKEGRDRDFGR